MIYASRDAGREPPHLGVKIIIFFQVFKRVSSNNEQLYGREYDQGKVTYNDKHFQQKSLFPIPFSSRSCQN